MNTHIVTELIIAVIIVIWYLIAIRGDTPPKIWPVIIGGMVIGNSMTGINLALNSIESSIEDKRINIEGYLMLGATPRMAMNKIIQSSFDTAITPTLNNIKNMGIISLPGSGTRYWGL